MQGPPHRYQAGETTCRPGNRGFTGVERIHPIEVDARGSGSALGRLARLERQRVDEERRALGQISVRIAALEERIEGLRASIADEIAQSRPGPAAAQLLGIWLQASARREHALRAELERLEQRRADVRSGMHARRIEMKRLEILLERRLAQAEDAAARAEQREIEDLAAARHARGRGQRG